MAWEPSMPAWERVAADIRRRVASGELPPGTRLPAAKDIAEEMGVSRNTVNKAMTQLRHEGIVEGRPGYGTFVRGASEKPSAAAVAAELRAKAEELSRLADQIEGREDR
jgi:DNA-binding GntR family transcriptional regulator